MRDFVAKISLTALFVLAIFSASAAEKVTFEANSPLTVAVGEPFRVEFALNAMPDDGTFKAPAFEGFDVIAGPAEARGQSIQIVNNAMTRVINYTITYVLVPQGAGNVTVGAAEIAVEGTTYRTKPLAIEVVDEGKAPGGGGSAAGGQPQRREEASSESAAQSKVAKDDILLRAIVSRTSVFKGEPLRVTFKLYERVPVVGYNDVKFPSFNGFWAQELNTENARRERETFNGKVYETLVAKEYLLYPQQAGTLVIEPAEITAVAQVIIQSRRSLDPFFGGGHDFVNVPRKVQSPRINVTVKPLPAGALRTEALYDLILCCISGGMSRLYRKLYDEGLTNPGFGGEVLRVDGCCCILFTGESDAPDAVKQMLLDEIARIRAAGVDREIFTLCKNEKYGQLIENLENVEDSASQMADFALSGQTVAQQIATLAALTAEDADAALQKILSEERMAVMYIQPDGTAGEEPDGEEEMEE